MSRKNLVKATLVGSLFFISLGGWLLHYRIHPITKGAVYYIPFIVGIVSVLFVPVLFWFRKTLALAYLINGFSVILGTIAMGHFSVANFKGPITPENLIVNTLFADITLLWAKFAVGKALYGLSFLKSDTDTMPKGRYFRYPNMGWWGVHLFVLSLVYILGHLLWA